MLELLSAACHDRDEAADGLRGSQGNLLLPCRFDPLGLGANEERLRWFAESERVHARWAMLAVAGILVQVSAFFVHALAPSGDSAGTIQTPQGKPASTV